MAKLDELGTTGLAEFSGQIQEDFLRELRGKDGYARYNEMRLNSPVIGAMLLAIEQAVRGVTWNFTSKQGKNDPRLELLNDAWAGMSHGWNDHISEVLTMLPFGYSLFEIVYQRDDRGRILWRKFAIRGQDTVYRWLFDDSGGLSGVEQVQKNYSIKALPIERLLLYRTRTERGNPEGRSILRTAWIPYYYAKHMQQVEAIGIERDIAGMPSITLPEGANMSETDSSSDSNKAAKLVRNVRNDQQAGIVLPPGWLFELVSTGGSRQFDTDKIIRRYESRMMMSALAQFLLLGQENVGSLALSKDQTDFFTMGVNSTADIIADTFSKYAIPRLMRLNGYNADGLLLEHTPAGDIDIVKLSDFLQKTGAYITWTPDDELWLRQVARLPESDIDVIEAERERKQEQADALRDAARQSLRERVDEDERMAAEFYAADAPDDDRRRRYELDWEKATQKYFDAARRRLLRQAREMRRAHPA